MPIRRRPSRFTKPRPQVSGHNERTIAQRPLKACRLHRPRAVTQEPAGTRLTSGAPSQETETPTAHMLATLTRLDPPTHPAAEAIYNIMVFSV